jgi:hypothetical protein
MEPTTAGHVEIGCSSDRRSRALRASVAAGGKTDAATRTTSADIVPPCRALMGVSSGEPGTGKSDPALAEGGVIHHHPGIEGGS